jgi:hypothetical protein
MTTLIYEVNIRSTMDRFTTLPTTWRTVMNSLDHGRTILKFVAQRDTFITLNTGLLIRGYEPNH